MMFAKASKDEDALPSPPMVPYAIPFLGSAIAYGIDPIKFMQENYEKVTLIIFVS